VKYFLALIGIIGPYFMIRQREMLGDMLGGHYQLVIVIAVFVFFWSLATLTGTDDMLLKPLMYLIPGYGAATSTQPVDF